MSGVFLRPVQAGPQCRDRLLTGAQAVTSNLMPMTEISSSARGDRVRWRGQNSYVEVRFAEVYGQVLRIAYRSDIGVAEAEIDPADLEVAKEDGGAPSSELLAGFWSAWMAAATTTRRAQPWRRRPSSPIPTSTMPCTARCCHSRRCGSCSATSPAQARRSWAGCSPEKLNDWASSTDAWWSARHTS